MLMCCFVSVYILFEDKLILVSIDTESIKRENIYAYIALTKAPEQAGNIAN